MVSGLLKSEHYMRVMSGQGEFAREACWRQREEATVTRARRRWALALCTRIRASAAESKCAGQAALGRSACAGD